MTTTTFWKGKAVRKSASSSLIASILSLSVIVSSPAFGAPTSIANGDFETGENLATSFDGWTALNQRIDLGDSVIAGCRSVDTSDYSNLREWFTESGKEYFGNFEFESDGTNDYDLFLNTAVEISTATVNPEGTAVTFLADNTYAVGDRVWVDWLGAEPFNDEDAIVNAADASSFSVEGNFEALQGLTFNEGGRAASFVTVLDDFYLGFRNGDDGETAFLQQGYPSTPGERVFEQDWTEAQRAAVTAMIRDPEDTNDSFEIAFDGTPEFKTGLRVNSSEGDVREDWQDYLPELQWESQFVTLFSDMNGDSDVEVNLNARGYVVHGPAIVSDEFTAKTIDDLSFKYAASEESDDFKVFGYLLNTEDCTQTEVLDASGESQLWETVTVAIPANGTYRFVFVSGTYDQNWGTAAGAVMFLDDVTLSPNAERVAAEEEAAALANTGPDLNWLLATGFSAVLVGAAFLASSRRRRVF